MRLPERWMLVLLLSCAAAGLEAKAQDETKNSEAVSDLKEKEALYKQQEAALKAEQAAYEAQAARDKVKYGDPVTGKTGKVTEEGAFGELAKQEARRLAPSLAASVGADMKAAAEISCPALLLTSDTKIAAKTRRVQTLRSELTALSKELATLRRQLADAKRGEAYRQGMRGLTIGGPDGQTLRKLSDDTSGIKTKANAFLGTLNTIVGIVGVFQADYAAKAHTVDVAPEWYLPGVSRQIDGAKTEVISDVFPSTASSASIENEFVEVVSSAESLKAELSDVTEKSNERLRGIKKQADAIAASLAAAETKLYTLDQAGVAPMETLAQISSVAGKELCTAIVQSSVSAIQVTKETIFGKGGKMYLSFSLQLYWSLFNAKGKVLKLDESTCERVAVLDFGKMTKPSDRGPSLNSKVLAPEGTGDACGSSAAG